MGLFDRLEQRLARSTRIEDRRGKLALSPADEELFRAVRKRDVALVRQTLNDGAAIDCQNEFGRTPLLEVLDGASDYDEGSIFPVVEALLGAGADVRAIAVEDTGWTPLISAAFSNLPKTTIALLAKGADPDDRDDEGKTALQWVLERPDQVRYAKLARILSAASAGELTAMLESTMKLTSEPIHVLRHEANPTLAESDVRALLLRHGHVDADRNPDGSGIKHVFRSATIEFDEVVLDEATGLLWQRAPASPSLVSLDIAEHYLAQLNEGGFAGRRSWRLPTLAEGASLLTRVMPSGRHIDPVFTTYDFASEFTGDTTEVGDRWVVDFGKCQAVPADRKCYVRAVCSLEPEKT